MGVYIMKKNWSKKIALAAMALALSQSATALGMGLSLQEAINLA